MTTWLVNDMIERGKPYTGDEEGNEEHQLYDPDYDCPTYDEWKRYDDQRREHEEQRHGSYARYGY
jgi:hypothetical protein